VKPFIIEPNIYTIVVSEGSGRQNTLNCRTNRGVKGLRPPPKNQINKQSSKVYSNLIVKGELIELRKLDLPGGAPAHMRVVSSMCFQNNLCLS